MHECWYCGQMCACDQDDMRGPQPADCRCPCGLGADPPGAPEWNEDGFDVTDPDEDAPDGAVVDGMERHGSRWEKA